MVAPAPASLSPCHAPAPARLSHRGPQRRLLLPRPPSAYPFVATTLAPVHTAQPHRPPQPPQPQQPQVVTLNIFYRTSWPVAVLHGSVLGGPWSDYPLQPHPSAPTTWQRCTFQLPPGALTQSKADGTKLLEFVLTNKAGDWDKPPDGSNYVVTHPGTHSVSDGCAPYSLLSRPSAFSKQQQRAQSAHAHLRAPLLAHRCGERRTTSLPSVLDTFSPGNVLVACRYVHHITGKRVLVVSDLDGTMVGEDDQATAAFTQWWHDVAIPRGGVLVYHTGRCVCACFGVPAFLGAKPAARAARDAAQTRPLGLRPTAHKSCGAPSIPWPSLQTARGSTRRHTHHQRSTGPPPPTSRLAPPWQLTMRGRTHQRHTSGPAPKRLGPYRPAQVARVLP